jgi:hypothetical protein
MYILRCDAGRNGLGPVPLSRMWDDYKQMRPVQEAEQQLYLQALWVYGSLR